MKIFILEDNPERIKTFKEILKEHELTIAENVEQAKKAYGKGDFDILFLDHDLGGRVYVPSAEPNTGYQFAEFIKDDDPNCADKEIIIHSMNPAGCQAMQHVLPWAQLIPFLVVVDYIKGNPDLKHKEI